MKKIQFPISLIFLFLISNSLTGQERIDFQVNSNSVELTMPWNGGFNAPQFCNIDLNRDGIQDMISFDRQGDMLRTYLRMPASGRWVLDWQYTSSFPPLVNWVAVADYDMDGIEDLFTSSSPAGVAGITVYKGAYENDTWSFTLIQDRGKAYLQVPSGGDLTGIYMSWDDYPSITDVDGDGDIDVLAFEPGGSFIHYFKNQSVELGWGADSLRYVLADFCWGKILENEFNDSVHLSDNPDLCSDGNFTGGDPIRPRHAGSTVMTLDYDFDGDKDAWVGDITSPKLTFLHNGLNAEEAWITEQDIFFPKQDSAVYLPFFVGAYSVQLDDDPEPELLAAVNSRSLAEDRKSVWRYDDDPAVGPLNYKLEEKGFFQNEMIDVGTHSRPSVADVNGDGLPDLVVGGYSYGEGSTSRIPSLWVYVNQGSLSQPYFVLVDEDFLSMAQFGEPPGFEFDFAPAFGDIDANGTIDLIVGNQNGKLFFYKNNAMPDEPMNFDPVIYPYMNIGVGVSAVPQIADVNGDGKNDLIIGERTGNSDNTGRCSNLTYFENVGTPGAALFLPDANVAPNTQCFGRVLFDFQLGLPQYSTPSVVRTKEGLVLMAGNDQGKLLLYDNIQNGKTGSLNVVDEDFGSLDVGNRSAPALADLNADGLYELIVGNQRGGLELFSTELEVGFVSVVDPTDTKEKPYYLYGTIGNGIVDITWKNGVTGEIKIVNVLGHQLEFNLTPSGSNSRIDLSAHASGTYFLQIVVGNEKWVEKMVKY